VSCKKDLATALEKVSLGWITSNLITWVVLGKRGLLPKELRESCQKTSQNGDTNLYQTLDISKKSVRS